MTVRRSTKLAVLVAFAVLLMAAGSLTAAASPADQAQVLSYSKSASMHSNNTDVINGVPQPGTLLRLGQQFSVRSVPLGDIRAGETIKALSEVEVTNDLVTKDANGTNKYHDVRTGLTLVIATSPDETTGIEVAEAQSTYVTPEVHHWTFEKSGTFTAQADLPNAYLNLVMWASMPDPPSECWTFPRSSLPSPQQPRDCGMDVYYNRGHLSAFRSAVPAAAPADAKPYSTEQFSGPSLPEASPADAPITYSGEPAQFVVALARPVGTLKTGDIISAHSELQADARDVVRSNPSCNAMLATRLYLSPSPNSLTGATAIGTEGGYNFTGRGSRTVKTLEQGVVPSSGTFKLDRDYTSPMYVVLRIWTLGNSACKLYGNGIRIKLSQPESFMHVLRHRTEQQATRVTDTSNSGDASEGASALDVVAQTPVSVYSVPLSDLAAGDLVEALAEVEVETHDRRASIHTSLILADSPTATTGTDLHLDQHTEVNPYMAELPIHVATGWQVPSGISGTRYLNLVMYGVDLQSLEGAADNNVSIVQDGGRMVVQRSRPADITPPQTTIDAGPSAATNDTTPTFAFSSSEAGSTFQCRIDSAAFGPCSGPGSTHTPPALAQGTHSFEVRATDGAQNTDATPASRSFTVDTAAPQTTIVSGPSGSTKDTTPTFGFLLDESRLDLPVPDRLRRLRDLLGAGRHAHSTGAQVGQPHLRCPRHRPRREHRPDPGEPLVHRQEVGPDYIRIVPQPEWAPWNQREPSRQRRTLYWCCTRPFVGSASRRRNQPSSASSASSRRPSRCRSPAGRRR